MEQKKYDVFICYSRDDLYDEKKGNIKKESEINKILQELKKANISYCIDKRDIKYGDDFPIAIENNIKASNIILFLSTTNSNSASHWTLKEIAYAYTQKKHIIPVRIDESEYGDGIGIHLSSSNTIDYYNNPEQSRSDLINAIKKHLDIIKKQEKEKQIAESIVSSWEQMIQDERAIESKKQTILNNVKEQITDENILKELLKKICPDEDSLNPKDYSNNEQRDIHRECYDLGKKNLGHFTNKSTGFKIITTIASLSALCLLVYLFLKPVPSQKPEVEVEAVSDPEPMLVFAGGGSVYNYIYENPINGNTIDLRDYTRSIYIEQASGSAWALLIEEAYRKGKQKFHSVCLSAEKIDTTFMNEQKMVISDRACIIELIIGHDPLKVCMREQTANSLGYKSIITTQQLSELIHNIIIKGDSAALRLFSTSKTSGTLLTYQKYTSKEKFPVRLDTVFYKSDKNDKGNTGICFQFYDYSLPTYMNNPFNKGSKPFVVLGSQYYYPKELNKDMTQLTVTYDGNTIKKPICIYFIARNKNNDDPKSYIDHQVVDFLREIGGSKIIDPKYWEEIEKGYIKIDDNAIQPLNINDKNTQVYKEELKRLEIENTFSEKHSKRTIKDN